MSVMLHLLWCHFTLQHKRKSNATGVQIIHLICFLFLIESMCSIYAKEWKKEPQTFPLITHLGEEERYEHWLLWSSACVAFVLTNWCVNIVPDKVQPQHATKNTSTHSQVVTVYTCWLGDDPTACCHAQTWLQWIRGSMNQISNWKKKKTCKPCFCTCHFTSRTVHNTTTMQKLKFSSFSCIISDSRAMWTKRADQRKTQHDILNKPFKN